jgi:hypothetical protein
VLAAMMLGYQPAWSLGVEDLLVLTGIEALTVLVDNDDKASSFAGQRASHECFDGWKAAGREVWWVIANEVGHDMKDIGGEA